MVGILHKNEDDIYSFKYAEDWLDNTKSFHLSLQFLRQREPFGNLQTTVLFENLEHHQWNRGSCMYLTVWGCWYEDCVLLMNSIFVVLKEKRTSIFKILEDIFLNRVQNDYIVLQGWIKNALQFLIHKDVTGKSDKL